MSDYFRGSRFFIASLIALAALFAIANAQTTTVNVPVPGTAIPNTNLSFSPSIWMGARTNVIGNFANTTGDVNTYGVFVKPGFVFKYNTSPISIMTKYTFETSAAKPSGQGNTFRSVASNTYYEHEPIVLFTGKANDDWKMNLFGDLWIHTENKRDLNSFYELTVQPGVEYIFTPRFSVEAAYQVFRKNYFDTTVVADPSSGGGLGADGKAAVAKAPAGTFKAATVSAAGQAPVTTLHAGVLTANMKVGEKGMLVTFVRVGRQNSTILNATGKNYRVQTDLTTPLTKNITAALRYRLHIEDYDRAAAKYYNRGRVILGYAFNKNWSADVQNTLTVEHTTAQTSRAKYTNENYAGVTYKF